MERLTEKSQWRNPHTSVISTVERLVNTEPNSPTPPLVVYLDSTGVRAAEFTQVFLTKNEPYDPAVGAASAVEIMLPDYQVYFGEIPSRVVGLNYYVDATYKDSVEEANLEVRRAIDAVFAQNSIVPAGVERRPVFGEGSKVEFVKRPTDTSRLLRDQCDNAGLNYLGLVHNTPAIWGVRIADGSLTSSWIMLATCLRHAFRRVTFLYDDQFAAQSWVSHFTDAWNFMQRERYARQHEAFTTHIMEGRIYLQLTSHWYRGAKEGEQTAIEILLTGDHKGTAKIPYMVLRQLQAMYDMNKIIGGVA